MSRRFLRLFTILLVIALIGFLSPTTLRADAKGKTQKASAAVKPSPQGAFKPIVVRSVKNDRSIPLRDMKPLPSRRGETEGREIPNRVMPKALQSASRSPHADMSVQNAPTGGSMPATFENFEGSPNGCGCYPPDTNGDVGPNHYVQTVNSDFQVFNKSGVSVLGPININTIWTGFGGDCETHNDGDPVVLYDHLADRWLISQFAIFGTESECVAISTSGDPTGSWNRYQIVVPTGKLPDYPKLGVWPDGYYMTTNQFDPGTFAWGGAGVYALERSAMIAGTAAQMVYFDLFSVNSSFGGMLPSDLDGPAPAPGTPNVFAEADDESVFGTDRISLWDFHVDWVTPANSTFGVSGNPNTHLDTAAFDWDMCGFSRSCIPQPGTAQGLDAISDRLMHRLAYRNMGGYSAIVANHTVDSDGTDHAGVRWYELRNPGTGWVINQQGTYAPDSENRWMGSIAMDSAGNIALGFSVSSSATFPSIRYAGRLAGDAPGTMGQGEATIMAGTGNQTGSAGRWGDYSGMTVDSTPGSVGGIDCDFWYTTEYIAVSGIANWQTRVGAFTFAPGACGGPAGTLNGTITDTDTLAPIVGATVTVSPGGYSTTTNGSGQYQLIIAADTYDVTASAYGYFPQTVNGVVITDGNTTTQDFALTQAPVVTVSGTVTDNGGHGWPLYAQINITGYPGGPIYTDPNSGAYSVQLIESTPYTFNVSAISTGYVPASRAVTPPAGGSTENFALDVEPDCSAPGYTLAAGAIFETFETGSLPAGWSNVDNLGGGLVWVFNDPGSRGNNTGGSGGFAMDDSDHDGCCFDRDNELRSPVVDLTGQATVHLQFDTEYQALGDNADADISTDGGSTWTNVWAYTTDISGHQDIDVSGIAGNQANVMVRFHYYNVNWAWWWEVDNVQIGSAGCAPIPGGLLVGNTFDQNTGNGMNGVTVTSDGAPSETTTSFATPLDPALDDGFYILFSSLTGTQSFTATKTGFGPDTQSPNVVADEVTDQDFNLGAGFLVLTPNPMEVTVDLGNTLTTPLTVSNQGTAAADYELKEGAGLTAFHGPSSRPAHSGKAVRSDVKARHAKSAAARAAAAQRHGSPMAKKEKAERKSDPDAADSGNADARTRKGFAMGKEPASKRYPNAAGDVIQTWTPGSFSWGIAVDPSTENVWVDSPGPGWGGDDANFEYQPDGTSTGTSWNHSWGPAYGPADSTQNPNTGMIWTLGVAVPDDCIHELDPASGYTGNTICPPVGISQRGVAYDPETDTYFVGSWNDGTIHHFDASGNMLDETFVGLSISGLAYNPDTQHLFVMVNGSPNNISVLDAANGYANLGDFPVAGFGDFAGAGLELGCDGSLWAVNQSSNTVYQIDSGETSSICGQDVPWLSENPTAGTVPASTDANVDVTFDASVLTQPGDYFAHLKVKENTPYSVPDVQITMHVPLPPGWGYLTGTVNGLARCDAPGAPLNKATVFVDTAGTDFTLLTDSSGHYTVAYPAADGPATVTVSATGYVLQTLPGVAITAGTTTTQDFNLRLDAPCGDKTPTSFDVSLNAGGSTTLPLTLNNTGAGSLDFQTFETVFPLPPLIRNPFPARTHSAVPANGSIGPSSIRSLTPRGAQPAAKAPDSGWFFALPVPGGLVRYAHAQCDTQPNSYYIFSGVDGTFSATKKAWRYDATTNSWNALADLPTGSEAPTATCALGKIYVMGGSGTTDLFIYDIAHNTWSTGASLPRAVEGAAAGSWNGQVFLIGGDDDFTPSTGVSNEVDVYDIATDTWLGTGASMPVGTANAGFVQAGPDVFVVGGWGDLAPGTNVDQTQRYDMSSDTWSTGPLFSAHADGALTITDTALYAMGGDEDGGGFFDASDSVERLDLSTWPAGAWADLGDDLPVAQTANNAGFCTEGILLGGSVSEIWSVAGADANVTIGGNNAFHGLSEHCYSIFSDVPWLSESPVSGTVAHDSNGNIDLTFSAGAMPAGDYNAVLVVTTNDPGAPQFNIPVTLHVGACLFCDEFADSVLSPSWVYTKTWTESGDVLTTTTSGKATAVASPAFGGCQNCAVATTVLTGADTKVWIYGWWMDKNNEVELLMKEGSDKVILKQRSGGSVVKKQSVHITLNAGVPYAVTMTNNGATIVVNVDGTDIMTFTPVGTVPSGTVGFGAKAGTTSFGYIHVN